METAARQGNLPTLEYLLQDRLRSHLGHGFPIAVSCAMKQHILMVLVEHPAKAVLNWKPVFRGLEQILRTLDPEFTDHIRLYARIVGQRKPYAFHAFKLASRVRESRVSAPAVVETPQEVSVTPQPPLSTAVVVSPPLTESVETSPPAPSYGEIATVEPTTPVAIEEPVERLEDRSYEQPRSRFTGWKHWRSLKGRSLPLLIGAGGMLLIGLTSVYALTRPCVLGQCTAIHEAEELHQQSNQAMLTAASGQDLTQAQQQLTRAIRLLSQIPPWSSYHDEAQRVLPTYRSQADTVDRVLFAEGTAAVAISRGQNPPLPVARWQEVESLWQGAIAQLEPIPADSVLYPLAQRKRATYQTALGTVQKQMTVEQQAQARLATAKTAVRLAETRQGIAQSLESWQLAHATWQTVIQQLQQVPAHTTARQEAEQLVEVYQPKLARVATRKMQEAISASTYSQAIALAQKAQQSEQQNLWSQAVASWRAAVNFVNQVPTGTFYYNQSQPLVNSYTAALKQAEEKLQVIVTRQRIYNDLKRVCLGPPKICTYAIADTHIAVKLTSVYEQAITAAVNASTASDSSSFAGAVNYTQALQVAFQTISSNAGKPVEIYSTGGILIDVFNPD